MSRGFSAAGWLCLVLDSAGCGYSSRLALPTERRTVGIEVFDNDTPRPELERDLHLELVRSGRKLIGTPIVTPSTADLVVRGTIREYHRRMGVRTGDNLLLETGLTIVVEAELWDRARGALVAGPIPVGIQVGYTLDARGNESDARQRALRNVADRVLLDLFALAGTGERAAPEAPAGL